MDNTQDQYSFNFIQLIGFLKRWWKHLAIITFVAAVAGAIVSLVVKPKYESTVVFYPSTNNSISNALLPGLNGKEKDVLQFGAEEEAEQLLQLLNSDKLKWEIINRFHLLEHYNIDPKGPYPYTTLSDKFDDNVRYRRTEYASIEIAVDDEDPQMAADMANGIANLIDTVKSNMQKVLAKEALAIVEDQYMKKKVLVTELQDTLQEIAARGVYNFEKQSEGYAMAATRGSSPDPKEIEAISKYGSLQYSYQIRLKMESEALSDLQQKYDKAKVDAEKFLPCKFVVNEAGKSEKRVYPRRTIWVLVSGATAFIMAVLILIGIENFRKFRIFEEAENAERAAANKK